MSFKDFQDSRRGRWISERNHFSNSESPSLRCLPSSFGSVRLTVREEMSFEGGGHLGYRNRTILAILNLCVTVMPPIKFQLNPTYGLGDVV